MANLTELEQWEAGIYQLETTDVVEGGETGIDNLQPRQLANRTSWLKAQITLLANQLEIHEAAADPHPQYLTAAEGNLLVPAGTIIMTAKNAAPSGFLKANGAAISRTTYAALFSEIGTVWGGGDGVNTFNLPDFRGEFLRGFDDGRGVDSGRVFGSWQSPTRIRAYLQDIANNDTDGMGTFSSILGITVGHADSMNAAPDNSEILAGGQSAGGVIQDNVVWGARQSLVGASINSYFTTRPRNLSPLICIKY